MHLHPQLTKVLLSGIIRDCSTQQDRINFRNVTSQYMETIDLTLTSLTGCYQPCQYMSHDVNELYSFDMPRDDETM